MTIKEAEKIYAKDKKKYILDNNKEFLNWLYITIKNGYHMFINIDELQDLIDDLVKWYEIKYPERDFQYYEGISDSQFSDVQSMSDIMGINELLYRLSYKKLSLMECNYRSEVGGLYPVRENGKEKDNPVVVIRVKETDINENDPLYDDVPYYFKANAKTGMVYDNISSDKGKNTNLDELLKIIQTKYYDRLDYTELEECVYDHSSDVELRHRILQLVALKLLYSKNTTLERGYERAKRFINEMNQGLNLTLSTLEIDKIMNQEYNNLNIKVGKIRKIIKIR